MITGLWALTVIKFVRACTLRTNLFFPQKNLIPYSVHLKLRKSLVKESGRFFKACLSIEIHDSLKSEHSPTLVWTFWTLIPTDAPKPVFDPSNSHMNDKKIVHHCIGYHMLHDHPKIQITIMVLNYHTKCTNNVFYRIIQRLAKDQLWTAVYTKY